MARHWAVFSLSLCVLACGAKRGQLKLGSDCATTADCSAGLACISGSCDTPCTDCGGSGVGVAVSANVQGLAGSGLVLQLGDEALPISMNGKTSFTTAVSGAYAVTVKSQPSAPNQDCVVSDGSGIAGGTDIVVQVACTTKRYRLQMHAYGSAVDAVVNLGGESVTLLADGTGVERELVDGSAVTVSLVSADPAKSCGLLGVQAQVTGADMAVNVHCVDQVSPFFQSLGEWLQLANGPAWDRSATACISPSSGRDACRWAGLHRFLHVPGLSSCEGVTVSDSLNAFVWTCAPVSGGVELVSRGFAPGHHLGDLLDFSGSTGFVPMRLNVATAKGTLSSKTSIWWSDTVSYETTEPCGNGGLGPMIHAITTSCSHWTGGYTYGDSVGIVVAPGHTVRVDELGSSSQLDNFHPWLTGSVIIPNTVSMLNYATIDGVTVVGSSGFTGTLFQASPMGSNPLYGVQVRELSAENVSADLLSLVNTQFSHVRDVKGARVRALVQLFGAANDNVIERVYSSNGGDYAVQAWAATGPGGGATASPFRNVVANVVSIGDRGNRSVIGGQSAGNVFTNITIVNKEVNDGAGFLIDGVNDQVRNLLVVHSLAAAIESVQGTRISRSAFLSSPIGFVGGSDTLTGPIVFGGNTTSNCSGFTCAGATFVGVDPSLVLKGAVSRTLPFATNAHWLSNFDFFQGWTAANVSGGCYGGTCTAYDVALKLGAPSPVREAGLPSVVSSVDSLSYIADALEIPNDGVGDDDALCEASEACIASVNIGAYQGEGALTDLGTVTVGAIGNVHLYRYATNGR